MTVPRSLATTKLRLRLTKIAGTEALEAHEIDVMVRDIRGRRSYSLTTDSTWQRHEDRCNDADCVNKLHRHGKYKPFRKTPKTGSTNAYPPEGRSIREFRILVLDVIVPDN